MIITIYNTHKSVKIKKYTRMYMKNKRRIWEMDKKEKKQVCINIPIEVYRQLEKKADKRKLDKTNYIIYLIEKDESDMYSEGASRALNQMTGLTESLLNSVDKDDKIRPFVVGIRDEVDRLWRYLR